MNTEPFVTPDVVAQHLKITRRQVLQRARTKRLPAHPLCSGSGRRTWRFKISEVDQAILSCTALSVPKEPQWDAMCHTISTGSPRSRKEQSNG